MFYKVIFNDRVIDVLDRLVYLKYQPKHNMMVLCNESEAQAVLSSEKEDIWHIDGWYNIPVDGYDTVELIEIDEIEYKQLKVLNGKTPEQITDELVLYLIQNNII